MDFQVFVSFLGIAVFGLIVVIAAIYCVPIIFVRRFHHRNNLLTLNICFATSLCSLYWFLFYLILQFDIESITLFLLNNCRFTSLFPVILTLQVPFSFVTASINRFCSIVFDRAIFRTKRWIALCIANQWIMCSFLPLPILASIDNVNMKCRESDCMTKIVCFSGVHQLPMAWNLQTYHHCNHSYFNVHLD